MALQSLFGASSGSASGGTYPWMQQQLQPDQKKTINTVNAGVTAPTTNTSPLQPQYTVGQNTTPSVAKTPYGNAALWNVYNPKSVYNPMQKNSPIDVVSQQGGVANWIQQGLGINPNNMTEDDLLNLNKTYEMGSKDLGDNWEQQQVLDKNTGSIVASNDYYHEPFNVMKDVVLPAALVWGGGYLGANALFGAGGAATGGLGSLGAEGLSGMDLAADAALGSGNNIFTAGQALGGASGAAGAIGGSGFQAPAAGSTSGAGLNLGGAAPGSVYGTGSGLGIAPEAVGAASGGTGLGAMIGSSIPAGDILGGLGGALGAGSALSNVASQVGKTVGGSLVKDIIGKVLGGSSGGISNLGNLASLFTNHQQYNKMGDLIDQIKSIYKPDGDYAKYMGDQLARKDAAAGRNSQYGPRLAQLMGMLGDSQAKALSGLGGMMNTQQGGLNGMVGAGTRLADGMGLSDLISQAIKGMGSQGGMLVGEAGTTPSIWDRPAEDVDWESLFGG